MTSQEKRNRTKQIAIYLLTGMDEPFCMDCGCILEVNQIDFHHTDPTIKSGNPSEILRKQGVNAFLDEVLNRKCVCLCKDCHKDRHKIIGYKRAV